MIISDLAEMAGDCEMCQNEATRVLIHDQLSQLLELLLSVTRLRFFVCVVFGSCDFLVEPFF